MKIEKRRDRSPEPKAARSSRASPTSKFKFGRLFSQDKVRRGDNDREKGDFYGQSADKIYQTKKVDPCFMPNSGYAFSR